MAIGIGLTDQQESAPKTKPLRPLLRPRQVVSMTEEVRRIDDMLKLPAAALSGVDVPAAIRQRNNMKAQLDAATPREIAPEDRDNAVRLESELRSKIREGMCTQAEMRRNPAGAVDKHRAWEHRNKNSILEWKNLRLRMHATGMLGSMPSDAQDIANVETFRPIGGAQELNMHNEQIPGAEYHLPSRIVSQNHASNVDRDRWDQETVDLLADLAVTGDKRAAEVLKRHVGEDAARDILERARKNSGTPPEKSVAPKK